MPPAFEDVMAELRKMEGSEREKVCDAMMKFRGGTYDDEKSADADAGGASKATEGEGGGGSHASQRHAHAKKEDESSDVEKDGSQPMAYVSEVEKTWAFDADNGQQPLDKDWCDILKANDENVTSDEFEFVCTRLMPCGKVFKYDVDITDAANMTSTNCQSNKRRALRRMEMRVIEVKEMLAAGNTACIDVLQKAKTWKLQWQVEDELAWKNMTEDVNQTLLTGLIAKKETVQITHWWQHPTYKKWKKTTYDVHLSLESQTSREWKGKVRPVRLVALREWSFN